MNMQAFIFNWRGQAANAARLEGVLGELMPTRVINSDAASEPERPHWVHVGEEAYFSAQWNRALALFDGDVMLHVQADAELPAPARLVERAAALLGRADVGVYEPYIDFSAIQYDVAQLLPRSEELFEVPFTDCTCWFVAGDILRALPPVDPAINKYGWGICAAVAAVGRSLGKHCIRDYSVTVKHPRGRGYSSRLANEQRIAFLQALPVALQGEVARLYAAAARLRPAGLVIVPPEGGR
jgi:hypothetical protein